MNTLFYNNNELKRRRCDRNIHKAMQIPVDIYQKIKIYLLQFNNKKRM